MKLQSLLVTLLLTFSAICFGQSKVQILDLDNMDEHFSTMINAKKVELDQAKQGQVKINYRMTLFVLHTHLLQFPENSAKKKAKKDLVNICHHLGGRDLIQTTIDANCSEYIDSESSCEAQAQTICSIDR